MRRSREDCAFGSMRASRGSHPGEIAQNGLLILADDLTNRELVGSPLDFQLEFRLAGYCR